MGTTPHLMFRDSVVCEFTTTTPLLRGQRATFTDNPTEVRAARPSDRAVGTVISVCGDRATIRLDGFGQVADDLSAMCGWTFGERVTPADIFGPEPCEPDECRWCGCPSPESPCRYCGTRTRGRR